MWDTCLDRKQKVIYLVHRRIICRTDESRWNVEAEGDMIYEHGKERGWIPCHHIDHDTTPVVEKPRAPFHPTQQHNF